MGKTILACSGGGTNGAHHAGVLLALAELGIIVDAVVGVSTGATAAAFLSQFSPYLGEQERAALIYEAQWRAFKRTSDIRGGNLFTAILRAVTLRPSFYTAGPLERILKRHLVVAPRIPVAIGVVELESGDYYNYRPANGEDLVDAVVASASIPLVWPPRFRHGLVDGGVRHVSPLKPAFDLARALGWTDDLRILLSNCWSYGADGAEQVARQPRRWDRTNWFRVGQRALDIQSKHAVVSDLRRAIEINVACRALDSAGAARPPMLLDRLVAEVVELGTDYGYPTWEVKPDKIKRKIERGYQLTMEKLS